MRSRAPFRNRQHAAELLVEQLDAYRGSHPLVLGLPRGGVPMARLVADALGGEVDIEQVRKIGAPSNPQLAVAAIDEAGGLFIARHAAGCGADAGYLQRSGAREVARMAERRLLWKPPRPPLSRTRRTVIVIDDGIATGASMLAALRSVRRHKPTRLICAVAVAPSDALREVAQRADEVVCLSSPLWFGTIGQWFGDFTAVTDKQVAQALRTEAAAATRRARGEAVRASLV